MSKRVSKTKVPIHIVSFKYVIPNTYRKKAAVWILIQVYTAEYYLTEKESHTRYIRILSFIISKHVKETRIVIIEKIN